MTTRSEAGKARARASAASYPAELRARIERDAQASYERFQRTRRPRWLGAKLAVRSWLAALARRLR